MCTRLVPVIIIILYRLGIVNKSFCWENSPILPYFNQSDQYVYNLFIWEVKDCKSEKRSRSNFDQTCWQKSTMMKAYIFSRVDVSKGKVKTVSLKLGPYLVYKLHLLI